MAPIWLILPSAGLIKASDGLAMGRKSGFSCRVKKAIKAGVVVEIARERFAHVDVIFSNKTRNHPIF